MTNRYHLHKYDPTPSVRQNTDRLLEMVENGEVDKYTVILMCVKYMSEDDVTDMMRLNELLEEDEEDAADND